MVISLQERALGSYLGLAVGDALGATTEFMLPREIVVKHGVHRHMIGGGWLRLKAGRVTDDTEMCIHMANSILDNGEYRVEAVADEFVKWMKSKPVDIGSTVRLGIKRYMHKGITQSPQSDMAAGNGACMRNLPIIFYGLNRWSSFEEMTLSQSHITHNNKWSDLITLFIGEMTRLLLTEGDKMAVLNEVSKFIQEYPKCSYSRYKGEASGYIVDTFKTVMHYFFDSRTFEETLVRVVNQGGDADTNGAIAGMMAGALYGVNEIPNRWLRKLDPKVKHIIKYQTDKLLMM